MKYLVDTNVFSEQMKVIPNQNVVKWLENTPRIEIYTSVFVMGELRKGIDMIAQKQHPKWIRLNSWLEDDLFTWLGTRIFDVTLQIANTWGVLRALNPQHKDIDTVLAATCLVNDCTLVTRNTKDFERVYDLKILNPFI
jgi:predicted nucleic acid-binding protein